MEKKENKISESHIEKMNTLDKVPFDLYKELYQSQKIKRLIKFTYPKTVWWDEEYQQFIYFNPLHKKLNKCAVWMERIDSNGNLKPLQDGQ
jgi:hypothetical protein